MVHDMRAVFLDRDGVINDNLTVPYVSKWEEFKFLPGVVEAIRQLNDKNALVLVATNQSAVGRGMLTEGGLKRIHERMIKALDDQGARIDGVYCPHGPDDGCSCRKPRTGLLDQAAKKFNIDFKDSWFIGDSESDMEAGRKKGLKTRLLKKGEPLLDAVKQVIKGWDSRS
jgi:histidinol-phosphate phosphatase family protein